MKILDALKGIGGTFEVQRILGAIGTLTYTFAVPTFVAAGTIKGVTVTEFCTAFPLGLAACVGATAGAIALKDRNVATSKVIADTGSAPGLAAPMPPAGVQPVQVVNGPGAPVPVAPQTE